MRLPRVYPILDPSAACAAILQFRHKPHWDRATFATAQTVAKLCREAGTTFIVNDRADIAMLLEAGLHVGQDDLAPCDARKLMGGSAVIGLSSHNAAQLTEAANEPVDYVALGPIFPTASKRNPDPVTGVAELRQTRTQIAKPLVAIGGITLLNALEVLGAGADSVAVIAGFLPGSQATPATAQLLRERMEEWQRLVKTA
jgi:thiamine-phosphate pyrophosphorylase